MESRYLDSKLLALWPYFTRVKWTLWVAPQQSRTRRVNFYIKLVLGERKIGILCIDFHWIHWRYSFSLGNEKIKKETRIIFMTGDVNTFCSSRHYPSQYNMILHNVLAYIQTKSYKSYVPTYFHVISRYSKTEYYVKIELGFFSIEWCVPNDVVHYCLKQNCLFKAHNNK